MINQGLIIFAKSPELGRTKTRLIAALGEQGAMDAHCELVVATLHRISHIANVATQLWVTQDSRPAREWASEFGLPLSIQWGIDLGERMQNAIADSLAGGLRRIVLVGTDCPSIDDIYVQQALTELGRSDVVIGPAVDGGYGLIGMNERQPALFADVEWGSDRVLQQTLDACEQAGLTSTLLPEIWDVDRPADWQRYLAE
jgi:hypothetical protein